MAKKIVQNIKKHRGPVVANAEKRDIIECKDCGFKHIYPIPTKEEIGNFYAEFYTDEKPNYFKDAEEDLAWWIASYKNYYNQFEKHTKGQRLLDIGSGPGYFLKCGQDLGWEVLGFEPSVHAAEYSKSLGLNVINDYFTLEKAKEAGKFDVVSLSLVLEHLPDPKQLLEEARSVLNKKGLLFILSPNEFNPLQNAVIEAGNHKQWWIQPLEHINYFNFVSTKKLLKSVGFNIIDTLTTYPMEFFLLQGENYVGSRKTGRKCHKMRKNFEMNLLKYNPELLNNLYRSLADNGLGREFVIIAQKNG